jgi:uncharacterized protein
MTVTASLPFAKVRSSFRSFRRSNRVPPDLSLLPVGDRLASAAVNARDRLLLFIALDGAPGGLDPVRIQKGMFLFAQETAAPAGEKYQFVPYSYGPMSSAIYRDLDTLVARELVTRQAVEGQPWTRYQVSEEGMARAKKMLSEEPSESAAERLHAIKREVTSKSFSTLLDDVYERYPEYAVNSIFRRAS